jgi:hypothetical protein
MPEQGPPIEAFVFKDPTCEACGEPITEQMADDDLYHVFSQGEDPDIRVHDWCLTEPKHVVHSDTGPQSCPKCAGCRQVSLELTRAILGVDFL